MSIDQFFTKRVQEAKQDESFTEDEQTSLDQIFGQMVGIGSHRSDLVVKNDLLYFRFRKLSGTELAIENIRSEQKGGGRQAVERLETFGRMRGYQVIKARNIVPKSVGFWEALGFRKENEEDPNTNYIKTITPTQDND